MSTCRTRPSTSPTETSSSTSGPGARRRQSLRGDRRRAQALRRRPRGPPRRLRRDHRSRRRRRRTQGPFHGVLLGEWVDTQSTAAATLPRLSRPDRQVRPPRRATARVVGSSTPRASRPAGAATWASATSSYGSRAEGVDHRRLRDRSTSSATRSRPALRHGRALGATADGAKTSTSDPRRRCSPGRRAMTAQATATTAAIERGIRPSGDRVAACASPSASSSSSTASISTSPRARSSPCSGRTAPARRRPSRSSRRCSRRTPAGRSAGLDVASRPGAVRAAIGLTGQFSAVDGLLTGGENLRLMADLRHLGKDRGRARSPSCSSGSTSGRRHQARVDVLGRHAPAARPGHDPDRQPADHLSRRADDRPRSAQPARHVGHRPRARRRRRHDLPDHAVPRGGGPTRRPGRACWTAARSSRRARRTS